MEVRRVAHGLWTWTAPHPRWDGAHDWPEAVGCVYYEAPDAVVLIDPLVPRGEEQEFLAALDGDVERLGLPVAVLLTAPWHSRSADELARRYDAVVWAHEAGRHRLPFPSRSDALPEGVELFVPDGPRDGQVAFFIRSHGALVVAEIFAGERGGLRVCPSPELRDRAAFEASLRRLLELPIEHVLVSHGEPVLRGGRAAVERVLASASG